jgi:hypothetical protein
MSTITVFVEEVHEEQRTRKTRLRTAFLVCAAMIVLAVAAAGGRNVPSASSVPERTVTVTVVETRTAGGEIVTRTWEPLGPPPPPRLHVSPLRLGFEALVGGGSAAQLVSVANEGGHPLPVGLRVNGSSAFLVTQACPPSLDPSRQCDLAIVFAPKTAGVHTGELTVVASRGTQRIVLAGRGIAPPVLAVPKPDPPKPVPPTAAAPQRLGLVVEPRTLHFSAAGSQRVVITNPNERPIRIERADVVNLKGSGQSGYMFPYFGRCQITLQPHQSCTFFVMATPVVVHSRSAIQLLIRHDGSSEPATVPVSADH